MTLPTPEKTWDFTYVNQDINTTGDVQSDFRRLCWKIKDACLKNPLWAVKGSSNTTTGLMDGADRWPTTVVGGFSGYDNQAHPWMVLRRTDVQFEMLIDCYGNVYGPSAASIAFSRAGFSGSGGASPTATDKYTVVSGAWTPLSTSVPWDISFHNAFSTDGHCQRIWIMYANAVSMFFSFERTKNAPAGLTNPFAGCYVKGTPSYANLNDSTAYARTTSNDLLGTCYYATEGYVNGMLGERLTVPNDISGEYAISPISIVSETSNMRGILGNVYDMWFGISNAANGDGYPSDGSRAFMTLDDLVIPWNGSPLLMG